MIDNGFLSYPRYRAPLGAIPFHEAGEHEFTFSGLPDEDMRFVLLVPGFSSMGRDHLEMLNTQIAVQLEGSAEGEVCDVRGTPSGKGAERWTLESNAYRAGFWHIECNYLSFESGSVYSLRIAVSKPDQRSPQLDLRAVLEGGGNELP